jgi:hypothetical protein
VSLILVQYYIPQYRPARWLVVSTCDRYDVAGLCTRSIELKGHGDLMVLEIKLLPRDCFVQVAHLISLAAHGSHCMDSIIRCHNFAD